MVKVEETRVSRTLTLLETCDFNLPVSNHSTLGNSVKFLVRDSVGILQPFESVTLYNDAHAESDTLIEFT